MAREIKFRGWNIKKKEMLLPEYVDRSDFHIEAIGRIVETHEVGYERHEQTSRTDDWEIMQYTGLNDKNGKEIYEGDILKFIGGTCDFLPYGYGHDPHKVGATLCVQKLLSGFTLCLPVHYDNDIPNLMGKVDNYTFWNHKRSFEIIGNIYENPELLNTPINQ